MFRLECYCDDKKLGDVQRVLSGLIVAEPKVQYIANAMVVDGQVVAKTTAGNLTELVAAHFSKVANFHRDDVRQFLRDNGFSEGSAGYITQKLRSMKVIRTVKGRRGYYEHVPATKPATKSKG